MIHTTPKTQRLFNVDFDDYGDSYIEDTTPDRLKDVFAKLKKVVYPKLIDTQQNCELNLNPLLLNN